MKKSTPQDERIEKLIKESNKYLEEMWIVWMVRIIFLIAAAYIIQHIVRYF